MKGRKGKRFATKVDAFTVGPRSPLCIRSLSCVKDQEEKKIFLSSESNSFLERQ